MIPDEFRISCGQSGPVCPYCGASSVLCHSVLVYAGDKSYAPIFVCENYPKCDAYVSAHQNTLQPMGSLANKKLRKLREKVHFKFDVIWRRKKMTRDEAYIRLASLMGLKIADCHIALFDIEQCKKAIELIEEGKFKENANNNLFSNVGNRK